MRILSGTAGSRCDFCQRPPLQTSHLIVASKVAICQSCAILATLSPGESAGVAALLADALSHHPTSFDAEVRVLLANAVGALNLPSTTWHGLVDSLSTNRYGAATFAILHRIPRSSWRPSDWITYTWAASVAGQFDDVVSMSDVIPWDSLVDPGDRHILRANLAWTRCHSQNLPSAPELAQLLSELDDARQYWRTELAGPQPTRADALLSALEGVAAKCNLLMGRTDEAVEHLEAAASTSTGPLPLALILWGDILNERGNLTAARQKWQLAAKSDDARNPGILPRQLAERQFSTDEIAD